MHTLFCAVDVYNVLGYKNSRDIIAKQCSGVSKRYTTTNGGNQNKKFYKGGIIMNIIQSMIHEKLGEVRIIKSEDGNPMHTLFCAVDVVKSLGYPENSYRSTISRHCSAVRKTHGTDSLGREQNMNFIPLSDVFRLIDRSNKPEAIEFQDWLYEEVLPNLYQFGNYNTDNHITNPEFFNPEYTDGDINNAVQSVDMNRVIDGVLINDTIRIDTTNILRDSCIMIKDDFV